MVSRMMAAMTATMAMLAGCAKAPEPATPAPAAEPAAAPALPRTPSPPGAQVFIVSPKNGDVIASPVKVQFGINGMILAPAGTPVENAGHHHLLVDTAMPENLGLPLPTDEKHLHFGKAQTETTVTLAPGTHTLQLVLGDHLHIPFDPVVASPQVTITVK